MLEGVVGTGAPVHPREAAIVLLHRRVKLLEEKITELDKGVGGEHVLSMMDGVSKQETIREWLKLDEVMDEMPDE